MPPEPSTEVATRPAARQVVISDDAIPILDTARFEHMQRIAQVMAAGLLIPDSVWAERKDNVLAPLPAQMIAARCFMIVNQAVRWGMDPFAVAQCTSVIGGKLCYEGKLVQGVIEAKAGVLFDQPTYSGKEDGDELAIKIIGKFPDGRVRTVEGTVGEWKTSRSNSPWSAVKGRKRMLHYRGMREFGRFFTPALLLGIYTDDEMEELAIDAKSRRAARDVQVTGSGIAARLTGPKGNGFDGKVEEAVNGNAEGTGAAKEGASAGAAQAAGSAEASAQSAQAEASPGGDAGAVVQGTGGGDSVADTGAADTGATDVLNEAEQKLLDDLFAEFVSAVKKAEVEAVWAAFNDDIGQGSKLLQEKATAKYEAKLAAAKAAAARKEKK